MADMLWTMNDQPLHTIWIPRRSLPVVWIPKGRSLIEIRQKTSECLVGLLFQSITENRSLTVCPWKILVGRLDPFLLGKWWLFRGRTVKLPEAIAWYIVCLFSRMYHGWLECFIQKCCKFQVHYRDCRDKWVKGWIDRRIDGCMDR